MRTLCLQNAVTMAKAYKRWKKEKYLEESKWFEEQSQQKEVR